MNVLIILKTIFLYIKNLFYLEGFGTECARHKELLFFSIFENTYYCRQNCCLISK